MNFPPLNPLVANKSWHSDFSHDAQLAAFFELCERTVYASWVKADDPSFDVRAFLDLPLDLVEKLTTDTVPGGQLMWDARNALMTAFNSQYAEEVQANAVAYRKVKGRITTDAMTMFEDNPLLKGAGQKFGTVMLDNASSHIYESYHEWVLDDGYVSHSMNHLGRQAKGNLNVMDWGRVVPALVECGWFPATHFVHLKNATRVFAETVGFTECLPIFDEFIEQACDTARVMLAAADNSWLKQPMITAGES